MVTALLPIIFIVALSIPDGLEVKTFGKFQNNFFAKISGLWFCWNFRAIYFCFQACGSVDARFNKRLSLRQRRVKNDETVRESILPQYYVLSYLAIHPHQYPHSNLSIYLIVTRSVRIVFNCNSVKTKPRRSHHLAWTSLGGTKSRGRRRRRSGIWP